MLNGISVGDFWLDTWSKSYTDVHTLSEAERQVQQKLENHVHVLASEIGVRNTQRPEALEAAAQYIENAFQTLGLKMNAQRYVTSCGQHSVRNIESIIEGSESAGTIVVGAHYDTIDCPGANDNGSGVAALIEIANAIAKRKHTPKRTIRFVAFVNEEPPFFGGPDMGSWVYAQKLKESKEDVLGMICLETMGCYSTDPGSQHVPSIVGNFYKNDVGNFVGFCSNPESKEFLKFLLDSFRRHCDFPSEGLAVPPSLLSDITLSDNSRFWDVGFRAVMVTDTVYLRYKHYHEQSDTADKLNFPAFARVTNGLSMAVWYIAD
jgi:Zn-dependent M28 family amino/carboxypeptidase